MDSASLKTVDAVLRTVNRPIWILTAAAGGRQSGLVATFVSSGSIDPSRPLLVAALAPSHYTTELVLASRALVAHLLTPDQMELVWRFGLTSGRDHDKFAELPLTTTAGGIPRLVDCLAWLDCRVLEHYDAGDRLYFFAEVLAGGQNGQTEPLDERMMLAAASDQQKQQLKANLSHDIDLLRPLGAAWRAKIEPA